MSTLLEQLDALTSESLAEANVLADAEALDAYRLKYLGRKDGLLTKILTALPGLTGDEKREVGKRANVLKGTIESSIARRRQALDDARINAQLSQSKVDLTLPGTPILRGGLHPLTRVMEEITDVFLRLGFSVAEGPEVETDDNNFTSLNLSLIHIWRLRFHGETRGPAPQYTLEVCAIACIGFGQEMCGFEGEAGEPPRP